MPDTKIGGAALSAGSSLLGAGMQSDSADDAAKAQAQMYNQTRKDLKPYRQFGSVAGHELMRQLGLLWEPGAPNKANYPTKESWQKALADYQQKKDYYDSAIQSDGYGRLMQDFTGEDLENEPGYQFGMNQGMQALDRSAAARGNLLSGASLKAAQRFGQDYAGTKFNEAFQRDNTNKSRAYNWLMGVSTMGQNSAAQQATTNQQTGNALADLAVQKGNASSAGVMGAANAFQTYQNNQWQQNLLSSMNNNRIYQNASDASYSGWDPKQLRAGTGSGWG